MPTMILTTVDCPWGLVGHLVLGPHIISRGRRFVEADDERVHKRRTWPDAMSRQPRYISLRRDRSMLTNLCRTSLDSDPVRHSYNRQAVSEKTQSASRPADSWVLRQCMVRNFRRRRDCGLESRLFHFEFVDPLFQTGYRMFGFVHRSIFSVDGER